MQVYGSLEYIKNDSRKLGFWRVVGSQPAMMASRIIPNSMSDGAGAVSIEDNMSNVEHLCWLMVRYPLRINAPLWTTRLEELKGISRRRSDLQVSLQEAVVDGQFQGKLFAFQKEGLDFLLKTSGTALLADEMGLGKTIQSLAFLVTAQDTFPALIVAPLVTLMNWQREIKTFIRQKNGAPFQVQVIRSGKSGNLTHMLIKPHIYLINYDLVSKRLDDLAKVPFQTIILDECQHLRNPYSQKSRALHELKNLSSLKHRLCLSGTPCYNHGDEIWSIADFIYPGLLGTHSEFSNLFIDYYDSHRGVYTGKRRALYEILTQNIMLRRRKLEVLKDLPEKIRYRQTIQIDENHYTVKMQQALDTLNQRLGEVKAKTKFQAVELQAACQGFASEERVAAGVAKVPYVAEFVEALMDVGDPTVVFCHHRVVHEQLYERLGRFRPVVIRGGQSDRDRQEAIDVFQQGKTKLLIAGLRAGNVGINLTAASYVVFAELDWSPAIHRQAEDRLHRIGQTRSVFAYYLEGVGTLDEHMAEVLTSKKLELDEVLGDVSRVEQYCEVGELPVKTRLLVDLVVKRFGRIGLACVVPSLDVGGQKQVC